MEDETGVFFFYSLLNTLLDCVCVHHCYIEQVLKDILIPLVALPGSAAGCLQWFNKSTPLLSLVVKDRSKLPLDFTLVIWRQDYYIRAVHG